MKTFPSLCFNIDNGTKTNETVINRVWSDMQEQAVACLSSKLAQTGRPCEPCLRWGIQQFGISSWHCCPQYDKQSQSRSNKVPAIISGSHIKHYIIFQEKQEKQERLGETISTTSKGASYCYWKIANSGHFNFNVHKLLKVPRRTQRPLPAHPQGGPKPQTTGSRNIYSFYWWVVTSRTWIECILQSFPGSCSLSWGGLLVTAKQL